VENDVKDSLRVLIVEDEALLQMQLEIYVEEAGHAVAGCASSLRDALDLIRREKADLALVDVHLADGPSGVDVGRAFAEAGIGVVFLTANAKRIPGDFCGAIGVIGKPYTQASLQEALDFLVAAVRRPPPAAPVPLCLTLAPPLAERWRLT
jgi:DNA-binding response OmpR family regulator